jgi:hypothetical protein
MLPIFVPVYFTIPLIPAGGVVGVAVGGTGVGVGGKGVAVGDDTGIAVGGSVGNAVVVGVIADPDNCADVQPEITKLMTKTRIAIVCFIVFICSLFYLRRPRLSPSGKSAQARLPNGLRNSCMLSAG